MWHPCHHCTKHWIYQNIPTDSLWKIQSVSIKEDAYPTVISNINSSLLLCTTKLIVSYRCLLGICEKMAK